jgi:enoyl-CoA hydratase
MWCALPALVDEIEQDARVRVALVSGADSRVFAAGADISEFSRYALDASVASAFAEHMGRALKRLADLVKPSIAVIQGPCVGAGCGLALCCDFRFADTTATFGITAARLGVPYPLEDIKRLIDVVGIAQAKNMLMSGEIMDADRAYSIGLVDRVLPMVSLWSDAQSYASLLAKRSQYSLRGTKAAIAEILAGSTQETAGSRRRFVEGLQGKDLAEGARAFLEKRDPDFP